MKKILIAFMLLGITSCFAQAQNNNLAIKVNPTENEKISSDGFIVNVFTDIWQNVPDSITARPIQQGVSFSGMYSIPMGKGNFSFAFGLGLDCHNFYSNGILTQDSAYSNVFQKIPTTVNGTAVKYDNNKLALTYLEIPVEFRFKTASKFRFAVGIRFGFEIDAHTKYIGTDLVSGDRGVFIKEKRIPNIQGTNYTLSARIGYKWAILNASYSLNGIFSKDKGPQMFPISIGLTAIPF